MFGFLNKSRKFPDGRDLNRVFPGSKMVLLLVALPITCLLTFYHWLITQLIFMQEVPADLMPSNSTRTKQSRIITLANVLMHHSLYSKNVAGSFRNAHKLNVKMLLLKAENP
jgi:hypothetical protein